jgi:hypothetical protein
LPARNFFAHFVFLSRTSVSQAALLWRWQVNEYDYQDPDSAHHGEKTGDTKSRSYFARPNNGQYD